MNKKIFFEILRTISLTILAAFFSVLLLFAAIRSQVIQELNSGYDVADAVDTVSIDELITEYINLEQMHPGNYRYSLKLGMLYELKKDYKVAEIEYKAAIEKASYFEFKPQYYLALLYVKQNKLEKAQKLMDDIGEKPDKKLIKYKAEVFANLGDKYYDIGNYEDAVISYQKSVNYYKIIKSKKYKSLSKHLASAYVYLADKRVNEMQMNEAISYLMQAKNIVDYPIVKYKLALLLMDEHPYMANKYFEEVYKKDPAIINYDTYNNLLLRLYAMAQMLKKPTEAKLYKYKIDKFKEYYDSNILSVDDIAIDSIDGKISIDSWRKKYTLNIQIKLKNTSNYDINSLFLYIVFKNEDEVLDSYSKQIVDKKSPLKSGETTPLVSLKAVANEIKFKDSQKQITVQIIASKSENSYKLLLKEIKIKEKIKPSKNIFIRMFRKFAFRFL